MVKSPIQGNSPQKLRIDLLFFWLGKCGGLNPRVIGLFTARVPTHLQETVVRIDLLVQEIIAILMNATYTKKNLQLLR